MSVSRVKGDFCSIDDYTPSKRTLDYIAKVNEIADMESALNTIMTGVPMFMLFAGRGNNATGLFSSGLNVTTNDWILFADAMGSVGKISRTRMERIAQEAALYSRRKDGQFWRYAYNAL
ncbi:hypothetical protein LRP50_14375 [Enterovibrio sp. ZSDZ42]|uniref:Uncharacterized protein n=1 Tax=Enterovibrio gelatinilyticus TaxID=2899819 RepID=A0ABT5R223_9GAMM|nr:hypothetical protein [Enterovibrio sp. ZSDZ42]MDD1794323.1 hypothetical protein [Enterovibrio sp. ZSDZ42]